MGEVRAMAAVVRSSAGMPDQGRQPARRQLGETFAARPDQVRVARAFVGRALAGCAATEDAVLVCSELASNAVQHSASARPGGEFTVRVEVYEGEYVWLEVEDAGGPWRAGAGSGEGGRGLVIVSEVADFWDVEGDEHGRVVCVRLELAAGGTTGRARQEGAAGPQRRGPSPGTPADAGTPLGTS